MDEALITRLASVEARLTGTDREIRDLKARFDRNDELMQTIHKIVAQNENILTKLDDHNERLKALEQKPGKRWDTLLSTCIAALATGAMGYLIAALTRQ